MDGNKRTYISTRDISVISSNPPYINIHHPAKKYMHKGTLKSVSEKLDNAIFVRVHKSTIVNITKVQSYRSRLNGDYDLLMHDGTELRLSRNYASKFKSQFARPHQDTP
jgi:DNA-binding LytR/AlgR family response regulator